MDAKPKLLQIVPERIPAKHYSYRTEGVYVDWIRRFALFNDKCSPSELGAVDSERFLFETHGVEFRLICMWRNNWCRRPFIMCHGTRGSVQPLRQKAGRRMLR